jgi:hypothetical protein
VNDLNMSERLELRTVSDSDVSLLEDLTQEPGYRRS